MKKTNKKQGKTLSLFEKLDAYFDRKNRLYIILILLTATVFSILMFDPKINMMGDESDYILHGYKFAKNFEFPPFRGPLYSIFLSPFIIIFGMNITMMKILSVILVIASIFLLYKAFYKRIPTTILYACLLLLCINGSFLFYSSAVLSEPLFLLFQSLLIYLFCKFFIGEQQDISFRKKTGHFFIISIVILLLTLTRTVGYASIGVIAIYFLFFKQWKNALLSITTSAVVFGVFGLIKKLIWPTSGNAYNLKMFFTKDMYHPDKGMEDLGGIITRVFENINNFLSRYVAEFLGLKSNILTSSVFLTVVLALLFLWGGIVAYRNNKPLFFTALHTLGFCLANFVILHATWMQERIIIVYYPLILIVIFTGFYYLLKPRMNMQFLFIVLFGIVFFGMLNRTMVKVKANSVPLKMALKGNTLYSLTPDWQNYILMSRWAAKNIPENEQIAVRKSGTSTIYTGRDFYGIHAVPTIPKDSLKNWKPGSGKTILVIDLSSKNPTFLSPFLKYVTRGELKIVGKDAHVNGIYEIDTIDIAQISAILEQNELTYTLDYDKYLKDFLDEESALIHFPEAMLNRLKNANVRYMILASLRLNPNQNTGSVINTLHNYISILNLKYPDIVIEKYSVGEVEPAVLIELNY